MNCCYDKSILCVYASSYGGCLCSACINEDWMNIVDTVNTVIIKWRNEL